MSLIYLPCIVSPCGGLQMLNRNLGKRNRGGVSWVADGYQIQQLPYSYAPTDGPNLLLGCYQEVALMKERKGTHCFDAVYYVQIWPIWQAAMAAIGRAHKKWHHSPMAKGYMGYNKYRSLLWMSSREYGKAEINHSGLGSNQGLCCQLCCGWVWIM